MSRPPKNPEPAAAAPPAPIDARAFLAGLDKAQLASQIDEAKARVRDAAGELRALQQMEKLRAYRAGEIKWGQGSRKKKADADAAAAGGNTTRTDDQLKADLIGILQNYEKMSVGALAAKVGADSGRVLQILGNDRTVFGTVQVGDKVGWRLRG